MDVLTVPECPSPIICFGVWLHQWEVNESATELLVWVIHYYWPVCMAHWDILESRRYCTLIQSNFFLCCLCALKPRNVVGKTSMAQALQREAGTPPVHPLVSREIEFNPCHATSEWVIPSFCIPQICQGVTWLQLLGRIKGQRALCTSIFLLYDSWLLHFCGY